MIPERTKQAIDQYVSAHTPRGGFLTAVLSNDLKGAFGRADEENRAALFDIVGYCYNEIPSECWGSPAKVEAWLAARPRPAPVDDMPDDIEAFKNERAERMWPR